MAVSLGEITRTFRHPGENRDLFDSRRDGRDPGLRRDDGSMAGQK